MKSGPSISSLQNKKLKFTVLLRERKGRRATGLFIVEGAREISRALKWSFEMKEVFYCPSLLSDESKKVLNGNSSNTGLIGFEIDEKCFSKLAMREGSDGLIGVFKSSATKIEDLDLSPKPLFLVVEGIEKPGNLGAILRTADGVGVDAVIIAGNSIDLFNPNVIRSSVGSAFTVPVVDGLGNSEILEFMKSHGIKIYGAALSDRSAEYYSSNFSESTAIVLGSEAKGLSDFWLKNSNELIIVPMNGVADSLNVSVAGAVILYEANRQRVNLGKTE